MAVSPPSRAARLSPSSTAFAKVADVVHVLQTAFKGMELVFVNLKAVQISVAEAIIRLWLASVMPLPAR